MKFESNQFGGNERAKEQDKDRRNGGYGGDYYDENEHRAGQEKYDLATGEAYRNDKDIEAPEVIVKSEEEMTDPIKLEISDNLEKMDPATKWLLENGFDEYGNEKPKKAA